MTASGKSALALELAKKYDGEIICADSRTVYRDMDIGTAKPSAADRSRVRHHCLDLVNPGETFNVSDFKSVADKAIDDIRSRGKLPLLVGGTGLYIDAVLYNFQFRSGVDVAVRAELLELSVAELQERLTKMGLYMPENDRNPRHLIRAIETRGRSAAKTPLDKDTVIIGIDVDREELRRRITMRVDDMFDNGFIEEAHGLFEKYGDNVEALNAPGYKAVRGYLSGETSLEQAKAEFVKNDMNLAKRQKTWFKRNKSIHWISDGDKFAKAVDILTTKLNK